MQTAPTNRGGAEESLDSSGATRHSTPRGLPQVSLAQQIDRALSTPILTNDQRDLFLKVRGRGYATRFEQRQLDAAMVAVAVYRSSPKMPEGGDSREVVGPCCPTCHPLTPAPTIVYSNVQHRRPQSRPAINATTVTHGKEEADDYPAVVYLDGRLRVIECKDCIQWIVQTRSGSRWRGISYHRDRDVMIRRWGDHPALRALPEFHLGREVCAP